MLRIVSVSLLLSMISYTAAYAQSARCEPEKVSQKYPAYAGKVVQIAASPGGPPYSFANPQNPDQLVGLEVEMIANAMDCAGLKYQFVKGAWSGLLASLMEGQNDMMIGAVNYRADRAERADFVLYMRVGQSIVVQKGNPRKLTDSVSLCGAKGSATVGGSSAQLIEKQNKLCIEQGKPAIDFLAAPDSEAAYRQVTNGRNDFVMDDATTAAARVAKEAELEIASTATSDLKSGMVVKKGNSAMLQIIADGLRAQMADGTLATLAKKYGFPSELLIPIEVRQ